MAIAGGVNIQKLGVAATLFAQSFTHAGVQPADFENDSQSGLNLYSQDFVARQQVPVSITVGGLIEDVVAADDPVQFALIVQAENPVESYILIGQANTREDVNPELMRRAIVEAEQGFNPQSVTRQAVIEVAEEPPPAAPLIVPVEPVAEPRSFTLPANTREDIEPELYHPLIVEAPRHAESPPLSLLQGPNTREDISPELYHALIHDVDGHGPVQSATQGALTEEPVVTDLDAWPRIVVEAEQPRPVVSLTQAGVIPDDVVATVELEIVRRVIVEAEQSVNTPQSVTAAIVRVGATAASIVFQDAAEPQEAIQAVLSSGVPEDVAAPVAPEENQRLIVTAQPVAEPVSVTRGANINEDVSPELYHSLIVEAEPLKPGYALTRGTFLADDVVPADIVFGSVVVSAESPRPAPAALVQSGAGFYFAPALPPDILVLAENETVTVLAESETIICPAEGATFEVDYSYLLLQTGDFMLKQTGDYVIITAEITSGADIVVDDETETIDVV